ncbi:hypothetical protein B7494_g409 [Chlorociboria aeruginascens]|nr:hypothetical protein B7494_g409 [Chlorociboria aeruginascens]
MSEIGEDGGTREVPSMNSFENLTMMRNRRTRPPPIEAHSESIVQPRIPLRPEKLQRRESKVGLRSIFTRNKADKNTVVPGEEDPVSTTTSARKVSLPGQTEAIRSTIPPTTPSGRPSRMGLRTKQTAKEGPKSTTKSATKSSNRVATRASPTWDPPPLFQAYPQAIKQAQLPALVHSADAIIRVSNQKRNANLVDQIAQDRASTEGRQTSTTKTTERAKSKHRRQVSSSISKADWTQKIFVLVTSGYLLQYAGEGSFDRLPEKMLLLGKDSVAFASDLIPGKHWVLQVSQAIDSDGTPTTDSRSLFSRLAFRGADYRRTATSFLLVFNSAEEMDSWIAIVRREIESLGGKKHVSETGKPKSDSKATQLRSQPSRRSLTRDSEQVSNPASPRTPSFGPPPWAVDSQFQDSLDGVQVTSSLPAPEAYLRRPSTSQQPLCNSGNLYDGRKLQGLRDNGYRLSYMSSGQRTLVASQASSPATSPTQDTFEEYTFESSVEDIRTRPNVVAINEHRRSMQPLHMPVIEAQKGATLRPHSSYGPPVRAAPRPTHATVTNFSVPGNSSKRYSVARNAAIEAQSMPNISATRPNQSRESILKGSARRIPPKALNLRKPLSLAPSPRIQSSVLLPAESPVELMQKIIPTAVNVPPRSPTLSSTINPVHLHQRSSLLPQNSLDTVRADFQFPRRFSSIQGLHGNLESFTDKSVEWPLITPPLSPSFKEPRDNEARIEIFKESPPPSPITTKPFTRRPISMQHLPRIAYSQIPSSIEHSRPSTALPTPQFTKVSALRNIGERDTSLTGSSSLPRSKSPNTNSLPNRKSMFALMDGPPPAPPPNYALPPLPPVNSPMRNSVEV